MTPPLRIRPAARAEPSFIAGAALALAGVAITTAIGLRIAQGFGEGPVALLFIVPVLATAVALGFRPALVAAAASTLAYDYYFTAPYRTFLIHGAGDAVTVAILFLVALVASRLAASLREQARLAAAHAARNATIAGFARKLLSCTEPSEIATVATAELTRLFECNSVIFSAGPPPDRLAAAPAPAALSPSDMAALALAIESGEPAGRGVRRADPADWQFRPVASGEATLAAIGLARDDGRPPLAEDQLPLLDNLIDQVALALERARTERRAREMAALRERDAMRLALLTSIGDDLKPRLAAIAAEARALRRERLGDKTAIGTIVSEVTRLDRYVDNLVALEPGATPETLRFGDIAIDLHRRIVSRGGEAVHLTPKEYALIAELARHGGRVLTHAQLLRTVWGPAQEHQIDYLRVAIAALRRKLEADPAHPALIVNEPAVGYRLRTDAEASATAAEG